MKAWTALAIGLTLSMLNACQATSDIANAGHEAGDPAAGSDVAEASEPNRAEEIADKAVAVAGAGPPLVVVAGKAAAIARCLHGKLAEHQSLASMKLAPAAPVALENGTYRLRPRKAILVQLSPSGSTTQPPARTQETGMMTYTTTVAPAGGNRAAVYFKPETPDLSGTVLGSLMDVVRKTTHRQARVCAL